MRNARAFWGRRPPWKIWLTVPEARYALICPLHCLQVKSFALSCFWGCWKLSIWSQEPGPNARSLHLFIFTLPQANSVDFFAGSQAPIGVPKLTHLSGASRPKRWAPSARRLRRVPRRRQPRKCQFPSLLRTRPARHQREHQWQFQRRLVPRNVPVSELKSQSLRLGNFDFGRKDVMTSGQQKNRCAKTCLHSVQFVLDFSADKF